MTKNGILGILVTTLFVGQLGLPVAAQSPAKDTVQQLVTLFSAWRTTSTGKRNIFDEAARHIDYGMMAEMSFTPAQWESFSPAQKKELVQSFRKLVENRYYERWHKLFLRSHLSIANEATAGGDIYVRSYLTEGRDEDTVIWRLHPNHNELMVVSLDVNGKDLLRRLADRFQKQLKRRGSEGFIAWLTEKAADSDDDASDADVASNRHAAAK